MKQNKKKFHPTPAKPRKSVSMPAIFCRVLLSLVALGMIFPPVAASAVQPSREITVSAAISLKNAFEDIGRAFELREGIRVVFNFGGSGALMQQILQGAPVDVFAPAAEKDMDELAGKGVIDQSTIVRVAKNSLVLIVPERDDEGRRASVTSFASLGAAAVQRIAVGNPKTVPAGRYAQETIAYYHLLPSVKEKFIYTENVRQALDYVARGEVDAGIVYATDARERASDVRIAALASETSHSPIVYPIGLVRSSSRSREARAFIAFMRSAEAKKILQRRGFTTDK